MNLLSKYVQSEEYARIKYEALLGDIKRVLALAETRCLSASELISRIPTISQDPNAAEVILCLSEVTLSAEEQKALFDSLKHLGDVGDRLNSREKPRVDRIVGRMGRLLPERLAAELAISFLHSKRKSRREVAYRLLGKVEISKDSGELLLRCFRENRDQRLLQILAKNQETAAGSNAEFLLQNIEEYYWRVRVLEALIRHDTERAIGLATSYPREFVHAVGRCKMISLAEIVHSLADKYRDDFEFLSLYVWALGKIGDLHELERVHAIIEEKLSKQQKQ